MKYMYIFNWLHVWHFSKVWYQDPLILVMLNISVFHFVAMCVFTQHFTTWAKSLSYTPNETKQKKNMKINSSRVLQIKVFSSIKLLSCELMYRIYCGSARWRLKGRFYRSRVIYETWIFTHTYSLKMCWPCKMTLLGTAECCPRSVFWVCA
jgi:hypothetical protein